MLLPLLTLVYGAALAAAKLLSLSELQWTLQNAEGLIKVSAQQPSQVHLDLKDANVITEPLLGINGKCIYLSSTCIWGLTTESPRLFREMDRHRQLDIPSGPEFDHSSAFTE